MKLKGLIALAMLESMVLGGAVLRFTMGDPNPSGLPRTLWLVGCLMTASLAIVQYVLRAMSPGPENPDVTKQALSFGVGLLVLAGALVALGPASVARMLG